MKYYNVEEKVTLHCDASERGLGAALLQNGQPVAFASRTLSPAEQKYAQIEKECLAITFGCQKFAQYVSRREKVNVETDHKPLQSVFKKSLLSAPCRLQRMLLRLQRYNLEMVYKPGSQMFVADHLSRASLSNVDVDDKELQVFAMELEEMNPFDTIFISSERIHQLQRATEQDPEMQTQKTVKALTDGAIFFATCNAILPLGDVKLANTSFHHRLLIYSERIKHSLLSYIS